MLSVNRSQRQNSNDKSDPELISKEENNDSSNNSSSNSNDNSNNNNNDNDNKEEDKQQHTNTCVICSDNEIECVFIPCGHAMTCEGCSTKIDVCSICRKGIDNRIKIFISSLE